ncbi:genetic competence negative regulator [Calditerricola satsumensis]|uniref:Adapter protein MecA n=1 Tax=Calditerricola satsumensis TaxID=373054 RepID=A0A8J3B7P8_9BACI|nr:genetic competence negative regulator [Calditerricola satsumensis]GGJ94154.1 adapter protein MecA [Calditerricola satsumensis]
MRIERLSPDKVRFFLTFDDLTERGIAKEDMWRDIPKVHDLFQEMMEQAYLELGFEVTGPVAVEVFALPAQGMVVIVTRGKSDNAYDDEGYEMHVTLEESDTIVFAFPDVDQVIEAIRRIRRYVDSGGKLHYYRQRYVLSLPPLALDPADYDALIAILSEHGEPYAVTMAMLEEYGSPIAADGAIETLWRYFGA